MMRLLYFGALLSFVAGSAAAAETFRQQLTELEAKLATEPTNTTILFKLGDLCHDEGARDNAKAVELAEKYFKQLLAIEPTNAFATALLGSALTMRARDAFWPKTRLDYVKKGIRVMDTAVQLAPEDPDVRLVRAINSFHMPKFLERDEIAKADFTWLWQRVEMKPEGLKDDLKQNVAFFYGRILKKQKKTKEAIEVWNKGHCVQPRIRSGQGDSPTAQIVARVPCSEIPGLGRIQSKARMPVRWRSELAAILVTRAQLEQRVRELSEIIQHDFTDCELVVVALLTGTIMFLADLIRRLTLPLRLDFIGVSSYGSRTAPGQLNFTKELRLDVCGRDVLVVDDILDTGQTLSRVLAKLRLLEPRSIKVCVLLEKQARRTENIQADYVGFSVPDLFVVGYGLDFAERYRNLPSSAY